MATWRFSRMRSWPMYSSSRRGRSPASSCASSSTRAGVTKRSLVIQSTVYLTTSFRQLSQCLLQRTLEPARRRALDRGFDGSLGERPMISQVHQRREQIVAERHLGYRTAGTNRRRLHPGQAVLQLESDPLRRLLADARNGGEARDVAAFDRQNELRRLDARQHGERELRSDAADADQPLEQVLLEQGGKPVQG